MSSAGSKNLRTNLGQGLTKRRGRPRIPSVVTATRDLANLLETFMAREDMTIADLARASGLSYKEAHRIVNRRVTKITDSTIDRFVEIGVADRATIVLAAYNPTPNGPTAKEPPRSADDNKEGTKSRPRSGRRESGKRIATT
ncbi:hypothetical protein LCGC14_2358460 [marine sediment metagenome]|uniref:HTH cro/C1-type domain-containing protein n=1 Tax=marine sediment metagenome TaxID=412755 RepID=A0A0F9C7H9_9ZZZZ